MAAGDPWWGAKYSYGVWERFADQANPFLKKKMPIFGGGGGGGGGGGDGTLPANPPPNVPRDKISRKGNPSLRLADNMVYANINHAI